MYKQQLACVVAIFAVLPGGYQAYFDSPVLVLAPDLLVEAVQMQSLNCKVEYTGYADGSSLSSCQTPTDNTSLVLVVKTTGTAGTAGSLVV